MKKVLALAVAVIAFASISAFAASSATPVRIALIPSIGIPANQTVHGLDFGFISDNIEETQGLQLSWFWAKSAKKMVGVQYSLVTKTEKLTGVQFGLVDLAKDVNGVQWGFYNSAKNVSGLQLGWINICENMNGIQIGLINNIKNSKLPWMVIANAKFK